MPARVAMGGIASSSFNCEGSRLISQNKSDSNELASVATHPDTGSTRITLQVSKSMLSNKAISRHISNVKSSSSHLFKKLK